VLAAEANGRTRLVVNVDSLLPYTTKVDGNTITVTSAASRGTPPSRQPWRTPGPVKAQPPSSALSAPSISGAAPDGTGRVIGS